jgi:hypothetical protein
MPYLAKSKGAYPSAQVTAMFDAEAFIPSEQAPFENPAFESIATSSITTSGVTTTITFSSIPQTFTHLQLRSHARVENGGSLGQVWLQFNGDTASNYYYFTRTMDNTNSPTGPWDSADAVNLNEANHTKAILENASGSGASANYFSCGVTDIQFYTDTNRLKSLRTRVGTVASVASTGQVSAGFNTNLWNSTAAVSSITLTFGAGNSVAAGSHFALYGIRG